MGLRERLTRYYKVTQFTDWLQGLGDVERERAMEYLQQLVCVSCGGPPECSCENDE